MPGVTIASLHFRQPVPNFAANNRPCDASPAERGEMQARHGHGGLNAGQAEGRCRV
jgi:hypothetical protein